MLKTHFEQIPVETVKKIAQELRENAIENEGTSIETQDEVTSSRESWREVAQEVHEEKDAQKMIALVEKLIAKLDEAQIGTSLPRSRSSSSGD